MLARESARRLDMLRRLSVIAERTTRNGLARSSHGVGDFSVHQQTRSFRMIPRKNFMRARSTSSALGSQLDVSLGTRTKSSERSSRRKASYAPPASSSDLQFGLVQDEEFLLEKEAVAVKATDESQKLIKLDGVDDEAPEEQAESQSLVAAQSGMISVVEAYHVAKTIDLAPLIMSSLTREAKRKRQTRTHLLLELSPDSAKSEANPSFIAIYRFGSVVFFNVSPRVQIRMLQAISRFSTEPQAVGFEQKDTFGVYVMPHATRSRVTPEHCIVPELNMNAVAVMSEVMAQSVALESYSMVVDSLLDDFGSLNSEISTSSKVDLDKKVLFSKIAQNNRIFIDLISKLRIKGRSEIAWEKGEYEVIHSGMIEEFELDDRFELIQFKLDLIQQNSKLFLEVIQHQKSASLEWIIVVLIAFECGLMCLEMSGQGTVMFDNIKQMLP